MISTAVIYDHRNRIGKDGDAPIEVRITIDRKIYYINTGIRVVKANFVGGTIVNQYDADELNRRLEIIYKKIQEELNYCMENDVAVDVADIRKKAWAAGDAVANDNSLLDFIEEQEGMMQLTPGTLRHYRTLRLRLAEYGQMRKWSDVTAENICKWDAWLHKLKRPLSDAERKAGDEEQCIGDGTVYNYHKCLKAILYRAVLFGRIEVNPYVRLRGKFKRGDKESVEYLTQDEMRAVESLQPVKGTTMAVARDLFVFQMHTGLSYADTQAFDFGKYYQDTDGSWVTVDRRVKTGVQYMTRLTKECERILEKYGWKLPKIQNAEYNQCLKALGAAVGIEKPLHSHLARHSFATKMTASGVAIQNVSKMLGHANITQTQRYAKVLPESVFADMRQVELNDNKK